MMRALCCTYDDQPPILDVSMGGVCLTVSVRDIHAVTDADVAEARGLLAAVREYVSEIERVRDAQRAGSDAGAVA